MVEMLKQSFILQGLTLGDHLVQVVLPLPTAYEVFTEHA